MSAVPTRTPLIAGNWKMHKTVAAAEEFIQALLPRVSTRRWRRRRDLPAVPGARGDGRLDPRLARAGLRADHAPRRSRARSPARSPRRCWPRSASTASCSATPSAAQLFGETDKALALKVPAALEAGFVPVLCVGETEDERERGDTERKLRHQVQEDLSRVPAERLGEVVIAYEPIWAIGTGRVATAEQAQEAVAFVRALVAGRSPRSRRS